MSITQQIKQICSQADVLDLQLAIMNPNKINYERISKMSVETLKELQEQTAPSLFAELIFLIEREVDRLADMLEADSDFAIHNTREELVEEYYGSCLYDTITTAEYDEIETQHDKLLKLINSINL